MSQECIISKTVWPYFEEHDLPKVRDVVESRLQEMGVEVLYTKFGVDEKASWYTLRFVFTGHLLAICCFNWGVDPLQAVWQMSHITTDKDARRNVKSYDVCFNGGSWRYKAKGFESFCEDVLPHFKNDIVKYYLEKNDGSVAG